MRLLYKLLFVVALPAVLIWAVGSYATKAGEESLRRSYEERSADQARTLIDEIDRAIQTHLAYWQAFARNAAVRTILSQSNADFEQMGDAMSVIERREAEWKGRADGRRPTFQQTLISNPMSRDLRSSLEKLEEVKSYPVYGEVFMTNRLGVNVAQSGMTTDYLQADEVWWQRALADGLFIGDVKVDESAQISCVDLCIRVDDEQSEPIGVLKAVLNLREVFNLVDARASRERDPVGANVLLFAADRRIIHHAMSPDEFLTDGSEYFVGVDDRTSGVVVRRRVDALNDKKLSAYAFSRGVGGTTDGEDPTNLHWCALVERREQDVLIGVRALARSILLMSVGATLAAVVFSGAVAFSLSQRIHQLSEGTVAVSQGNLDSVVPVQGNDELSDLARRFNQMTTELKQYATSLETTNRELGMAKDAAETANQAKSDFLANVSHEIRTPMNAIIGMTELVLDTPLASNQRDYLMLVMESAESLMRIINEILDFSKIEAGKLELEELPFVLRELLGDAVKSLALRAHAGDLELAYEIDESVPDVLVGDGPRLRQIVNNLVGNAIKFTEQGEVVLRVTCDELEDNSIKLKVMVADTGIGIPLEKQQVIFDAFSQVDTSATRRFGGTGLGLTITSRLVDLMNGRLWVESEVGVGSKFFVEIPMKRGAGRPDLKRQPQRLNGFRVVLVDDNDTSRGILEDQLLRWSIATDSAANAADAMQILADRVEHQVPAQLVIADLDMPGTSGLELCAQIRSDDRFCDLPILVLAAADTPDDATWKQQYAIEAILVKPVKPSQLLAAIEVIAGPRQVTSSSSDSGQDNARSEEPSDHVPPQHILLVEDGLANQKLATALLTKWGHTVEIANNGLEALDAVAAKSFDVVLMDVQMPEMDGLEATRVIRDREQGTPAHLPILALTARAMKGDRERCLQAGMDGYVTKPIRRDELNKAIVELVLKTKISRSEGDL